MIKRNRDSDGRHEVATHKTIDYFHDRIMYDWLDVNSLLYLGTYVGVFFERFQRIPTSELSTGHENLSRLKKKKLKLI